MNTKKRHISEKQIPKSKTKKTTDRQHTQNALPTQKIVAGYFKVSKPVLKNENVCITKDRTKEKHTK